VSPDESARPPLGADSDGERVRDSWRGAVDGDDGTLADTVRRICSDVTLWETDLTQASGFVERVAADLSTMVHRGVSTALAAHIGGLQDTSSAFAPSLTSVR
jgi:mannitol-1-phosphate/altronate dehydrogenase